MSGRCFNGDTERLKVRLLKVKDCLGCGSRERQAFFCKGREYKDGTKQTA